MESHEIHVPNHQPEYMDILGLEHQWFSCRFSMVFFSAGFRLENHGNIVSGAKTGAPAAPRRATSQGDLQQSLMAGNPCPEILYKINLQCIYIYKYDYIYDIYIYMYVGIYIYMYVGIYIYMYMGTYIYIL